MWSADRYDDDDMIMKQASRPLKQITRQLRCINLDIKLPELKNRCGNRSIKNILVDFTTTRCTYRLYNSIGHAPQAVAAHQCMCLLNDSLCSPTKLINKYLPTLPGCGFCGLWTNASARCKILGLLSRTRSGL